MVKGTTLLSQLQALLPRGVLARTVAACRADRKVQKATCWSHLCVLLMGLLTVRQSLRDLAAFLEGRLFHLVPFAIGSVDRSTISYANRHRPATVLPPLLHALVAPMRHPGTARIPERLLRLDSTVIGVCSTHFPWAAWAQDRSGIRLHLALQGTDLLPRLVRVTPYKIAELRVARDWHYDPGTILCFDRGYFDPAWFATLHAQGCIWITRWRADVHYRVVRRCAVPKDGPIRADQIIRFSGEIARTRCTIPLRRIEYVDPRTGRGLIFLTNQLAWPAITIADLYRSRWQIETFFRWLKQTLKLRRFWSHDENGVQWQIWAALLLYVLLKRLQGLSTRGWTLLHLLRRLGARLFDRVRLADITACAIGPPMVTIEFNSIYS